jgi:hypothetical protein
LWERWDHEQEQQDYRAAQITCILANTNRRKGRAAFPISDFMPKRTRREQQGASKGEKRKQTVVEQIAVAKAITLAYGGSITSKKKRS